MNTNLKGYFQVDNDIFDNDALGLSWCDKLVYIYLSRCSNQGATAFPSYKTTARKCGMGKGSAITAVKILEKRRFIEVERSKDSCIKHNPNHYMVLPLPKMNQILNVAVGSATKNSI